MSRYSRQTLLQEIGENGQAMLQNKQVAIIGIGALGTVAAELLTRAGVGSLLLIDRDIIEESNLQRQTLFEENDIGKSKAATAKQKLQNINSTTKINFHSIHLNNQNISTLMQADLILDGTDNLQTRFLINDFCKKYQKTWIYAAAIKTSGYVMPIFPDKACIECFLTEANLDTCDTVGVLNTITTSIAALQVSLAFKILLGKEVEPTLYHYDIWNMIFKKINISKNENCNPCKGIFTHLENNQAQKPIRFCAAGKFQIQGSPVNFQNLKDNWTKMDNVIDDGVTLRFKNIMLFKNGRALINANTEEEALTMYSKYIGN